MPQNKIYVGNIAYAAELEEIQSLFEPYGTIEDIAMAMDKETPRMQMATAFPIRSSNSVPPTMIPTAWPFFPQTTPSTLPIVTTMIRMRFQVPQNLNQRPPVCEIWMVMAGVN